MCFPFEKQTEVYRYMSKKKSSSFSRRDFLKAFGIGSAATVLPGTVRAAKNGGELATLLDLSKCIGCGECVSACRESNAAKFPEPKKPFPKMFPERVKVSDWSEKRDVDDRLTPYNWLFIQSAEVEYNGESHEVNIPRRCMHCQNPPCANLCPWGACGKENNGIVRINADVCLGGSKCKSVCPWSIPQRQTGVGLYLDLMPRFAGNGVMYKCDRCHQKVAKGEVPACISACPEGVQTIGPREDIVKKAHALAEEHGWFIYGENENGGTNTLYVSPVPFDLLHRAVEKGPGKPGLKPVKDTMSDETNLALATLIAPVAGIAAGALGLGARLMKGGEKND